MELGLHLPDVIWPDVIWPDGSPTIAPTLAVIARDAEAVGFRRLNVMDHFWQLSDTPERERRALHDVGVTVFMGALIGPAGPGLVAAYDERVIPEIATW